MHRDVNIVEVTRPKNGQKNLKYICLLVSNQVADSLQQLLPKLLTQSLQKAGIASSLPRTDILGEDAKGSEEPQAKNQIIGEGHSEASKGGSTKFNTEPEQITLSGNLLKFITSTFTKSLSKEVWTTLLDKYPGIHYTENVQVAPTMETGMKEDK